MKYEFLRGYVAAVIETNEAIGQSLAFYLFDDAARSRDDRWRAPEAHVVEVMPACVMVGAMDGTNRIARCIGYSQVAYALVLFAPPGTLEDAPDPRDYPSRLVANGVDIARGAGGNAPAIQ